ncbi:unnamed protein product, partial [Didymodactylos carnosus]
APGKKTRGNDPKPPEAHIDATTDNLKTSD